MYQGLKELVLHDADAKRRPAWAVAAWRDGWQRSVTFPNIRPSGSRFPSKVQAGQAASAIVVARVGRRTCAHRATSAICYRLMYGMT